MSTSVAVIDEAACIGCAKCLSACPVDAILGASRQIHTVLTESCIGCDWCLPVCPVDCIVMVPGDTALDTDARKQKSAVVKKRYQLRKARIARERENKTLADQKAIAGIKESLAAVLARVKTKSP